MNDKITSLIISQQDVGNGPSDANKLCSFCHYDADGLVADYVVHYVKELKASGCDVNFVSNSASVSEEQLKKIEPYVHKIITRKNEGYDFAAYFTGYQLGLEEIGKYKQVIFANDSVYGPFYPLKSIFDKMQKRGLDFWGISDSFAGRYHIQSYFWVFEKSDKIIEFLNNKLAKFAFLEDKSEIVETYEVGITQELIKSDFQTGCLCQNEVAVNFELSESDDDVLHALKAEMIENAKTKITVSKRIRTYFSSKANRYFNFITPDIHSYLTGINSCWYSMIKYFDAPFIKASLLKNQNTYRMHQFLFIGVLKDKYPKYDLELIMQHLRRSINFKMKK